MLVATVSLLALTALTACGKGNASEEDKGFVGVSMPTKSAERWIADGDNIVKQLKRKATKQTYNTARIKLKIKLHKLKI